MNHQILTHSRMSCFRDCPRKHYIRYELGITQDSDGEPRKFGSAVHRALEDIDKGNPIAQTIEAIDDDYMASSVVALLDGYQKHYSNNMMNPIYSELPFDLPLVNPATNRPSTNWMLNGKIDGIVQLGDGRLALLERKTTTRDFAPGADYWVRLHMDQQLSIYVIAARALGLDISTIVYDVMRRPGLRPLMATPPENRKYKKDGGLYANQRDVDETPDEYGERISVDIQERPGHYFSRIEIARLDQDLDDCRAEVWQQQQTIRSAQLAGHWYRNPNNCMGMFKCDYLPICLNRDLEENTPQGFVRSTEIHPELVNATDEG